MVPRAGSWQQQVRAQLATPQSLSAAPQVAAAVELWDGRGTLVFTSSAGLYVEDGACDERGAVAPLGTSERLDKLLRAEDAVLSAGGCVVRAVGLYHGQRGAHTFFLRQGSVERPAQSLVNLVHYEDAARLVIAVRTSQLFPGRHPSLPLKRRCGHARPLARRLRPPAPPLSP